MSDYAASRLINNGTACALFRLPLEIREQIYESYFGTDAELSILYINRFLYNDCTEFIRHRQKTFFYTISPEDVGFDAFSRRCFVTKGLIPSLSAVKYLTVNIYPPNNKAEMFDIWRHVQQFCEDLRSYKPSSHLTIRFVEEKGATWAVNGALHASMDLDDLSNDEFERTGVSSILYIFGHFVRNVANAILILPRSYLESGMINSDDDTRIWANDIWDLITPRDSDEDCMSWAHRVLEDCIQENIQSMRGESQQEFAERFHRVAYLTREQFEQFKRQWPGLDDLPLRERFRIRPACPSSTCLRSNDPYLQIAMPGSSSWWAFEDDDDAQRWQEEPFSVRNDAKCNCSLLDYINHWYWSDKDYRTWLSTPRVPCPRTEDITFGGTQLLPERSLVSRLQGMAFAVD